MQHRRGYGILCQPAKRSRIFKVVHDTIYIYSNEPVAYKIDRQTEYSFWFHSLADEVINCINQRMQKILWFSPAGK